MAALAESHDHRHPASVLEQQRRTHQECVCKSVSESLCIHRKPSQSHPQLLNCPQRQWKPLPSPHRLWEFPLLSPGVTYGPMDHGDTHTIKTLCVSALSRGHRAIQIPEILQRGGNISEKKQREQRGNRDVSGRLIQRSDMKETVQLYSVAFH